jgi:hypothetical protein
MSFLGSGCSALPFLAMGAGLLRAVKVVGPQGTARSGLSRNSVAEAYGLKDAPGDQRSEIEDA